MAGWDGMVIAIQLIRDAVLVPPDFARKGGGPVHNAIGQVCQTGEGVEGEAQGSMAGIREAGRLTRELGELWLRRGRKNGKHAVLVPLATV